jgi:hypothetical protein
VAVEWSLFHHTFSFDAGEHKCGHPGCVGA